MIKVVLTNEQAATICKHFGKDFSEMEDYEIGELVDKLIDNITPVDSVKA